MGAAVPTSVPLVTASFNPFGAPNPFTRRPDPFISLLGALGGTANGQSLLSIVGSQQQLIQRGAALGPAVDLPPPTTITRFQERAATLRDEAQGLATVAATIATATRPTERDLLTARQRTSALVRTYNDALKLVTSAPLVLKSELADGLEATASTYQTELSAVGITIAADGTLSLDEATLADALAPSSTTLTSAATTLRDLGRALGTLGQQLSASPVDALRYAPPPDPRAEAPAGSPGQPPAVLMRGAGIVYAYLVARQHIRVLSDLGGAGNTGTRFNALI